MPISSPTDVTGCAQWLDFDALTEADGAALASTLADGSGTGHTMAAISGKAPTVRRANVNGHIALQFAGAHGVIGARAVADDFTIFQVFKPTSYGGQNTYYGTAGTLYDTEAPGAALDFGTAVGTASFVAGTGSGGGDTMAVGGALSLSAWHVAVMERTKSTGAVRTFVDTAGTTPSASFSGASTLSLTASANASIGCVPAASEGFYTGYYASLIVYNRVLTSTERADVVNWLTARYISAPVSTSLTAARTARTFTLTGTAGFVRAASATAARVARGFALAASAATAGRLTAARVGRGFSLAAYVDQPTAAGRPDATTADGWSRDRGFSLVVDAEPPVDPPPAAHSPTFYRHARYTYTPPTFNSDGWSSPTQTRTLVDNSIVGRHRFRFEGVDRTYHRGVPMRLVEDSHANPFGPEIAVLHCPQISPFEAPPAWLHDGAWLVVTLVDDAGATVAGSRQAYFVHNLTPELSADSWGFTVEAKGFLYEGDDEINKPNPTQQGGAAVPIGQRVADALNSVIGHRYHRLTAVDTSPAITRSRGSLSQTILGYVRDLLGTAWTSASRQWTVLDVADVTAAAIVLPNPSVIDYTLSAGQDGVTFELHEEQDEQPNVVYGEWIDPNGGRHQRLKFPRLHEDKAPAYPLAVGAVFAAGDGHTGFQPFSDWMRRNGFSSFDSQNTFLGSDVDDVDEAQDRMGVTIDGVVGAQTWGTAFNTGADVGDLRNAIYLPIAADPRVMPFLYAPDGAKIGRNPAYDPTLRRKETYINFGEGLTYRDVRRAAQQIVTRNTSGLSLVGQITVNDTDFEECSKLVARGGTTLRVRYLYGTGSAGVKFHLARIHRSYGDDGSVTATLDVDTKWRDAYTVTQIIERNKEARRDPARLLRRAQTTGLTQDTKVQFDADDIGRIYPHNVQGGFWRVVEFPAASWGTWVKVTAVTSPATEFALMLFEKEITPRDLDRLVGNPLSASHPYNAEATALKAAGLVQAWGSADQPAGYSKTNAATGYKSDTDPLTGRLEYDSSVEFAPANGASLFLAEWCAASTVIHETFDLQPVTL